MDSSPQEIADQQNNKDTLYRLRKSIGILGLLLPVLTLFIHGKLLASISHYYYTSASMFFTGIIFAFGLLLIAYKGHAPEDKEKISDDLMTNIAGGFAIIAVIIPTCCSSSGDAAIVCAKGYLFGHNLPVFNTIHLLSAAIFIFILGWMCRYKFTRSKTAKGKRYRRLYIICGYVVWACVGGIALIFVVDEFTKLDFDTLLPGYTFILESVALYAFAIAWLVKGDVVEDVKQLKQNLLKK